ncbi:hypothetical protein [Hyphomicrobium facile]|uniref:Uncharacterized protein n=1 Tax=Hyphomicrobium facile TaxID=51670 RepID=A0A1I7MTD7_9HYPH|nr:hypothetical protein [Hyphomicrobium facile]SFV25669.1 hypothetical protein SAMN04488557_0007 [Hyphomicrobium facile]
MYSRASDSTDAFPSYELGDVLSRAEEPEAFYAGEPISAPPRRRGNPVRKLYLFLFVVLAAGAGLTHFGAPLQQWIASVEQIIATEMAARQPARPLEPVPAHDAATAENSSPLPPPPETHSQSLPEVVIAEAPGAGAASQTWETNTDAAAAGASSPPAMPADPYRKRAEAAGLHPDLSHVLLAHLTATDYRNAAFAIDKAVKTVPDDGNFAWPRSGKGGVAVFNVHFVPGAGRDCRRYVVTVTKDRWTTTALPMERCGVKLASRGQVKEQSVE